MQFFTVLLLILVLESCGWILQHSSTHTGTASTTSTPFPYPKRPLSGSRLDSDETNLRVLYPPSEAYTNGTIQVDYIHNLYYEMHGMRDNSSEPPLNALFLHGGPGAGCFPTHARFFDPERYRIVLLDQRGSGKSHIRGDARNNTLAHLVHDCETLRLELGISRWDVVLGGSWGTTLAIAYAQSYPDSVGGIILRGVCLLRTCEVDWLFSSQGIAKKYPEAWKEFEKAVNVTEEMSLKDPRSALHAHYSRLLGNDADARSSAARSWMKWEFLVSMSHKLPDSTNISDTNETMAVLKSYNESSSPVFAYSRDSGWVRQDAWGQITEKAALNDVWSLRQGIMDEQHVSEAATTPRYVESYLTASEHNESSSQLPAQSMLTCFYSTNDRFVKNNQDLLSSNRMNTIRKIPCVAVQGGSDRICPPDTALDLWKAWPEIEMRIPIKSGHSMYDQFITHELVRATDGFAQSLKATDQ
jgi:proline iminopeptidase